MQALTGLIRTMRPKQWTKNVLFVFPAIVFDGKLFQTPWLGNVLITCILMILMSGTVYIINDLVDIEKDKQHPRKKNRPLPSGQLPIQLAIAAAIIIPVFAIGIAFLWNPENKPYLGIIMVIYLVIQLTYSFKFKHIVILDVMTVTAGFVLRVLAGFVVIDAERFSPWLFATTGLLALFLVVGKRRQELATLGENALKTRPIFQHYNLALLDEMLRLVLTSTFITYLLYTIEVDTVIRLGDVNLAILTVPFVLYGLFHYLYLIHVKGEGGAPDEILLNDRPLQIIMLLWGLTVIFLLYVLPQLVPGA